MSEPSLSEPSQGITSFRNLLKAIGPGILVSCAAVGGSHLVWSTRAGAQFGWSLVGLILLANLFKFPFFLYGQRYSAATGESLLDGYLRQGKGYLWIFLCLNVLTGMINIASVAMVAGALLGGYGIGSFSLSTLTIAIIMVCTALMLLGRYKILDGVSKLVMSFLAISTLAAAAFAMSKGPVAAPDFVGPSPWNWANFGFLITLLGWMPMPVDLSAWASLWMFSRKKQTGHMATVKESSVDFYIGYVMAVVLAVAFVALGKYVMFGSGETFSNSGIAFSNQLVNLYCASIGDWSRLLILSAAFFTMFSTTLTCVDGYPRSLAASCTLLFKLPEGYFRTIHNVWIVLSAIVACITVKFFVSSMMQLLVFASVLSFLTSPILAYINLKVMRGENVPQSYRPGLALMTISVAGLIFFALMTAGYLYVTFVR
ncbi:MAG: divalent metal cation transporter [Opitutales bacterium]|nr:divalent metal cation transporter [Opitutales bacterium]